APPPALSPPPAVAPLHGLAPAVPADRPDGTLGVHLHLDGGVLAQEAGHGAASTDRHAQRISGSGASGPMTSTRRAAAPVGRCAAGGGPGPRQGWGRAGPAPSRAGRHGRPVA